MRFGNLLRHGLTGALAAGCLVVLGGSAIAQGTDDTLSIPHEKYTLDNGLEVILHEDHTQPLVAVSVWYHVGAYHEEEKRSGFAHLFEHMMFQGSQHVGDDRHISLLQEIGGTDLNGTTNFDRTNYFETVPSNHLETALWLESDRMGFLVPSLSMEKLDNQRAVVKNERRQRLEAAPYGIAQEKSWQALFPQPHPYHGRVIGSMADLNAATLDDVRGFFETYYAPSNATLVVAGDFDLARTKGLIDKYFGTLPKKPKPTEPEVAPPVLTETVVIEHEETIANLPMVTLSWHSPTFFSDGDADLDVLANVLSGSKAARLDRKLQFEMAAVESISAYQYSTGAQSVFTISATIRPGVDPKVVVESIDKVVAEVREKGVTKAEVKRAVDRYETYFVNGLQSVGGFSGRAELLQSYNHHLGDPGKLAWDIERYRGVTTDSVKKWANTVLDPNKRVELYALPKAEGGEK